MAVNFSRLCSFGLRSCHIFNSAVSLENLKVWRELAPMLEAFFGHRLKWTCRDLNPRPPPCEGGALPLSYKPPF